MDRSWCTFTFWDLPSLKYIEEEKKKFIINKTNNIVVHPYINIRCHIVIVLEDLSVSYMQIPKI